MNRLAGQAPELHPRANSRESGRPSVERSGRALVSLIVLTWASSFAIGFELPVLVLSLVGFGAAVAGLRRPALGLLGVGMLCTLDAVTRFYLTGGLWRWNTFNYWLLAVIVLSIPYLLQSTGPQLRLLQLFIVLLVLELSISADLIDGIQHLLGVISAVGLLVYFTRATRDQFAWYWLAVVSGCLAGAGGLAFYLQQERVPDINANAWAYFPLTALFAISLGFRVAAARRRGTVILSLLAAVNALWVFLSGSRGSMLIAGVCMVFLMTQIGRRRGGVLVLAAAVLAVLAVASQFVEQEAFALRRIDKLLDTSQSLTSRTSGRFDLVLGGWSIFLEHPLGIGTGGFAPAWARLEDVKGASTFRLGVRSAAHSGWIKVLAENGFLGFSLLAAFVVSFAVVGWQRRRQGVFGIGLLVTVALGIAFLSTEFQGKGLWLLSAGAMTLLQRAGVTRQQQAASRATAVGRIRLKVNGRAVGI